MHILTYILTYQYLRDKCEHKAMGNLSSANVKIQHSNNNKQTVCLAQYCSFLTSTKSLLASYQIDEFLLGLHAKDKSS